MRTEKGITLVALVITIIVMLILVAVSVTFAVQSGLFDKTDAATKNWKDAEKAEAAANVTVNDKDIDTYVSELVSDNQ